MAKLKVSVSKDAFDQDSAEQPKPGVYVARVAEINTGFSKGDDNKPDKTRPRLEVILKIEKGQYKGARLYRYVTFSDASEWAMAQFLKTFGISDESNAKGNKVDAEIDTSKIAAKISDVDPKTMKQKAAKTTGHPGMLCKVRVSADTNLEGEYRAKATGLFPYTEESSDDDDSDFATDAESEDAEAEPEDADADEEFEDEDEDTAEDTETEPYTKDDLKALDRDELKEVAEAYEVAFGGKKKSEVIDLILKAQEEALSASSDDDDDEEMPF